MHKWEFKKRKVDVLARESQATSEQDDSQMEIHAAAEENPHSKKVCFFVNKNSDLQCDIKAHK